MTDDELKQLARDIALPEMEKHGLLEAGWEVGFSTKARSWAGHCFYRERMIRLSIPWLRANSDRPDQILDTIRHEIAHALAGPGAGHGPRWRAMCLKVGARPTRCTEGDNPVPSRYVAKCTNTSCSTYGETIGGLNRKPRRTYLCRRCYAEIAWEPNPELH